MTPRDVFAGKTDGLAHRCDQPRRARSSRVRPGRGWKIVSLIVLLTCGAGCRLAFVSVERDLAKLTRIERIRGRAHTGGQPRDRTIVLLFHEGEDGPTLLDFARTDGAGHFLFTVTPGRYSLSAFVDENDDLVVQPGEPAARYAPLALATGERREGVIEIDLVDESRSALAGLEIRSDDLPPPSVESPSSLGHLVVSGEVVRLDDARFSPVNGRTGLWKPFEFAVAGLAGLYFLEPYDVRKVPVLFVHGAGGNPAEWTHLVSQLDRERYQPWLVYYPSGLELKRTAERIARLLDQMRADFGWERMLIVAHSMGGLVARGIILELEAMSESESARTLITLATPWGGMAAADLGVRQAPVVVPSWRDVAPGSAYLQWLDATPLPDHVAFVVLFGWHGYSMIEGAPSDGTVTLDSQLTQAVQQAATTVHGFPETHTSILRSDEVAGVVIDALDAVTGVGQ